MGADTDVYNACIDIILHQCLSIPEYLNKKVYMHIKVKAIETTSFCQDFSHKTCFKTINDSVSVIISCYVRYLLKIWSERSSGPLKYLFFVIFQQCVQK